MDVMCTRCGEPFDLDDLDWLAESKEATAEELKATFFRDGCESMLSNGRKTCKRDRLSSVRFDLSDLMGDDIDGYASLMEEVDQWQ